MKLTYENPRTVYERAITSCESKIMDLENRPENQKRSRTIEVQMFLLKAALAYGEVENRLFGCETPQENPRRLTNITSRVNSC